MLIDQHITHSIRPPFGKSLVVSITAYRIGMPFNSRGGLRVLLHEVSKTFDIGLAVFFNIGLVEIELNIQLYPNRLRHFNGLRLCFGRRTGIFLDRAAVMVNRCIRRGSWATVTTVKHAVVVFITILGVTNQRANDRTGHRSTCCPRRTFDCAQTCTGQTANRTAQGPVPLVERRISRTGSCDAT